MIFVKPTPPMGDLQPSGVSPEGPNGPYGSLVRRSFVPLPPGLQGDGISTISVLGSAAMKTCDKCSGTMMVERAVDLDTGLSMAFFACLNCGRRKAAEAEPRPLTARQ